jgi:hypothetical protein
MVEEIITDKERQIADLSAYLEMLNSAVLETTREINNARRYLAWAKESRVSPLRVIFERGFFVKSPL